ncbi:MAG: hypothetical protein NC412_03685 [Roseburia sp.]|nr:hypothetical protein [Roseburia sp.]MCM1278301.1 hypothetical protein [Robinsoniella sp.]
MSGLLEVRENLRNFYSKYEVYLIPLLKFVLALTVLVFINGSLGYNSRINNLVIVLVVALMCSFLPVNFSVVLGAVFIVLHMYSLAVECALVSGVLFLLLFLLYFRFSPKDTLVLLLLPLAFTLRIPYVVVLAVGLLGTPVSIVSVSCGVMVYYLIYYVQTNAAIITSLDGDNPVARLHYVVEGMLNNKAMFVTMAAFAITVILVYLIRRLSVDHAWTISMIVGIVTCIVMLLLGDLMFDVNSSIAAMIIGAIVSFLLAKVLEFFAFNVDYTRTEYVQFEDDEYYYYVKAIPKNSVKKAKKTVKKITSVL